MNNDYFSYIIEDAIRVMSNSKGTGVAYLFTTEQLNHLLKTCKFKVEYRIKDDYIIVWKKDGEKVVKLSKGNVNPIAPPNFEVVAQKVGKGEISIRTACELLNMSFKKFKRHWKEREDRLNEN